jgi:hypothetical protein
MSKQMSVAEITEISLQAKEFIALHGKEAEEVAQNHMFQAMQDGDVRSASVWLAVAHEIRYMQRASGAIN